MIGHLFCNNVHLVSLNHVEDQSCVTKLLSNRESEWTVERNCSIGVAVPVLRCSEYSFLFTFCHVFGH